jgi:2-dehydro-3-deoxyphosphogluconate aldolase/(4S)-4-hydroxy-2-oxoglutarate aldolase
MTSQQTLSSIAGIGIIPVVRAASANAALSAIEAIYQGGIRVAEITMTVPGAIHVLEKLADRFGDTILLGAGTVLDPETARACLLAGATFLVTPALNLATIELAKRYSKAICPGALTPTEVVTAWQAGADAVKIFPANALGGANYIRALKGPLPQVLTIPTGGVNLKTVGEFLRSGAFAVGVGSELVDSKLIKESRFDEIAERARNYVEAVSSARTAMADASA